MKAMVLRCNGPIGGEPLVWTELPDPLPGERELRVRVSVCGVCRTDLHVIEAELPPQKLPLVPGHQVVGTVESLGPDCSRFRVGERVGMAWLRHTCGSCDACRAGNENLCAASRYTGYHADGGYAELAVVPEAYAYPLPPAFSDAEAAPLLCAGIVGYRALSHASVPPGGTLGLYGFGSSAHVVAQIALHRGCKLFVATRGTTHRELAREMGAHWVGGTHDPMPSRLDGAIVFAPAGEIVPVALAALKPGGTVALAGICMSPVPELDYETHLFHEKRLRSVEANTRADGDGLLAEAARIPIRPRVTVFPLRQANRALIRIKEDRIDGSAVLSCAADS